MKQFIHASKNTLPAVDESKVDKIIEAFNKMIEQKMPVYRYSMQVEMQGVTPNQKAPVKDLPYLSEGEFAMAQALAANAGWDLVRRRTGVFYRAEYLLIAVQKF